MAKGIQIYISSEDPSDLQFIQSRAVSSVEEVVEEYSDHFDGNVTVSWEWID